MPIFWTLIIETYVVFCVQPSASQAHGWFCRRCRRLIALFPLWRTHKHVTRDKYARDGSFLLHRFPNDTCVCIVRSTRENLYRCADRCWASFQAHNRWYRSIWMLPPLCGCCLAGWISAHPDAHPIFRHTDAWPFTSMPQFALVVDVDQHCMLLLQMYVVFLYTHGIQFSPLSSHRLRRRENARFSVDFPSIHARRHGGTHTNTMKHAETMSN